MADRGDVKVKTVLFQLWGFSVVFRSQARVLGVMADGSVWRSESP